MKLILEHLRAEGFEPPVDLSPSGAFVRFGTDNYAWCVCYQNFSTKSGEEYFTVVYGNWASGVAPREFCTLVDPSRDDRVVIKKRIKDANKLEVSERNKLVDAPVDYAALALDAIAEAGRSHEPVDQAQVPEGMSIHALGFKEKEYFYTSTCNRQIVAISKFAESDMLGLAPIEYWESVFPGAGQSRVDWSSAKSKIMADARTCGIFQPRFVRGAGVWNDANRIVVNMGDHLVVDGVRCELGHLESRYFYTLGTALHPLHPEPLTIGECDVLVDACATFKWIKPDHSFLMAGALVVSRVCGAIPVRPHTWITGGASTGKTTLLERLIQPIIGDSVLYVQGSTTEAGIRQSLRADAIPVVFDEFETTGQRSEENVAAIVEFLRAAWSDSNAMIVKGGASGNATSYQARCAAIVSSIRTKLTNDADVQRFARIELQPHGSDPEHWMRLSSLLDKIDHEYGERLFARTIGLVPVMLANFKLLKKLLAGKVGARFGDQYGMLLAGYSVLISDEVLTEDEARSLIDACQLSDEKEESKTADHEMCLNYLLSKKVQIEKQGTRYDFSVREAIIYALSTNDDVRIGLKRIGIRVDFGSVGIASGNHAELDAQIFRNTRWSGTWGNSLMRIPGAIKEKDSVWIGGQSTRPILLPLSIFQD